MSKVVLIGCGNVGMSYAYALMNQKNSLDELVLIDLDKEKIIGEAMDLNHCLAFSPKKLRVVAGDYTDCKEADIVVISAGANQLVGETRMDLIEKNSVIFKKIIDEVIKSGFDGIFLVATNPLDVMTYITWKYSSFSHNRVIGSGTSLDTARLRYLLSSKLHISPKNVHAYVMGEHGDSEFIPWSNASIGLQNINDFLSDVEKEEIASDVKNAAYEIIKRKGATYYGIGMCLVRITNAILDDENSIITVSSYDNENDVYIGVPSVINRNGIDRVIDVNLNDNELMLYNNSVKVIKEAIESIK